MGTPEPSLQRRLDEVEYRSLITALHRMTQKNLPITAAAAGLPQIPRLTGEAR